MKDTRFSNETDEKNSYERSLQRGDFVDGKLLSLKIVDENNILAKLQITEKVNHTFEMDLPMKKENDQLKIIITGQNIPTK